MFTIQVNVLWCNCKLVLQKIHVHSPRNAESVVEEFLLVFLLTGFLNNMILTLELWGARCSSVVRAFAHSAMGCRIDPLWDGPIELFLIPTSAP